MLTQLASFEQRSVLKLHSLTSGKKKIMTVTRGVDDEEHDDDDDESKYNSEKLHWYHNHPTLTLKGPGVHE